MNLYYVRVSTQEQNTDRQLDILGINKDTKGLYIDHISGKNTKDRPELLRMVKDAREGDIVYAVDLSRLGRNLIDTKEVITKLYNCGVTIEFAKDTIKRIDPSDPSSEFILNVLLSVYEFERVKKQSMIKQGWDSKKQREGYLFGLKPEAYEMYQEVNDLLSKGYNVTKATQYVGCTRASYYNWDKAYKMNQDNN